MNKSQTSDENKQKGSLFHSKYTTLPNAANIKLQPTKRLTVRRNENVFTEWQKVKREGVK